MLSLSLGDRDSIFPDDCISKKMLEKLVRNWLVKLVRSWENIYISNEQNRNL